MTQVVLPTTLTTMGMGVFSGCESLTSITFESVTPPTFIDDGYTHEDVLGINYNQATIYVPAESVDAYKAALPYYASCIKPIP